MPAVPMRHWDRTLCDDNGSDTSLSQKVPRVACNHQKLRRGQKYRLLEASESTTLPTPGFQTCSFQNCKRIHFCCVKPAGLWELAMATPENSYSYCYVLLSLLRPNLTLIFKLCRTQCFSPLTLMALFTQELEIPLANSWCSHWLIADVPTDL